MAKGANRAKMAIVAKMAKVATMDEMARVQCLFSSPALILVVYFVYYQSN